jgi:hypothetical protein
MQRKGELMLVLLPVERYQARRSGIRWDLLAWCGVAAGAVMVAMRVLL